MGAQQDTMQAIIQDRYGSPDVLRVGRTTKPDVGDRDVLVDVRAAGVDRGVWHLVVGVPYPVRLVAGIRVPRTSVPGMDVAGVVADVGKRVTRFRPGDEVFGIGKGTYAELAAAPEKKLAPKPANVTFEQAAALPISGLTALQAVRDEGRLRSGQRVVIVGAGGGVGTYAVQIAKDLGAEVTGVCSVKKVRLLRSLGVDHIIDYNREDFTDGARRWDLIVDIAGNRRLSALRRALTTSGTLVIVGGESGGKWFGGLGRPLRASVTSIVVRHRLRMLMAKERLEDLEVLRDLVETRKVVPVVGKTYGMTDARQALKDLERGRANGKLVLTSTSSSTLPTAS